MKRRRRIANSAQSRGYKVVLNKGDTFNYLAITDGKFVYTPNSLVGEIPVYVGYLRCTYALDGWVDTDLYEAAFQVGGYSCGIYMDGYTQEEFVDVLLGIINHYGVYPSRADRGFRPGGKISEKEKSPLDKARIRWYYIACKCGLDRGRLKGFSPPFPSASVAQLVEQRTENPRVVGSIPTGGTICGCSSSGRAPPCQGGGSEFEPRHPLHSAERNAHAHGRSFYPVT